MWWKILLLVAIGITLVDYACIVVGSRHDRSDDDEID